MKKLSGVSFGLILAAMIWNLFLAFIFLLISMVFLMSNGEDVFAEIEVEGMEVTDILQYLGVIFLIFSAILAVISIYFMIRIVKNRKVEQGQIYIVVILVLSIICFLVLISGIFQAGASGLFPLAFPVLSGLGAIMQMRYVSPVDAEFGMFNQGQYGIPPQGNPYWNSNPYGNPYDPYQQSPYGNPYDANQQNPYGQPQQNPYGQPQQNPYAQPQQNPFGVPPQQNPYGNINGNSEQNAFGEASNKNDNQSNN